MGLISRTASFLQFKETKAKSSADRSPKIKSRLFIRETAQTEKSLCPHNARIVLTSTIP